MTLSKLSEDTREWRDPRGPSRREKVREGVPIGTEETDRTGIPGNGILWDHSMHIHITASQVQISKLSIYVVQRTLNFTTLSVGYLSEGVVN